MTITEILESRGWTVKKETSIQVTAHNEFKELVINKQMNGELWVTTKGVIGGYASDPLKLKGIDELTLWLDI